MWGRAVISANRAGYAGHHPADLFPVLVRGFPDDPAFVHNDDPVRQLEDFVQVRRDQHHAHAFGAKS